MVLSEDGDRPMTRLSDTQLVILTAAAQRADLSVLPLPETLKLKGGALTKVMDSLRSKGLIRVIETDGRPQRVVLTSEGMAAIGVALDEQEDQTVPAGDDAALDDYPTHGTPADQGAWAARRDDLARDSEAGAMAPDTAPTSAEAGSAADAPAPATKADGAATKAKRKAKAKAAKPATTPPAEKPTPRTGTKQALMIEMLKRPDGATVEQIAAATGWQGRAPPPARGAAASAS
jgi:DNA-binding MarR family transcriptional regulator